MAFTVRFSLSDKIQDMQTDGKMRAMMQPSSGRVA